MGWREGRACVVWIGGLEMEPRFIRVIIQAKKRRLWKKLGGVGRGGWFEGRGRAGMGVDLDHVFTSTT